MQAYWNWRKRITYWINQSACPLFAKLLKSWQLKIYDNLVSGGMGLIHSDLSTFINQEEQLERIFVRICIFGQKINPIS